MRPRRERFLMAAPSPAVFDDLPTATPRRRPPLNRSKTTSSLPRGLLERRRSSPSLLESPPRVHSILRRWQISPHDPNRSYSSTVRHSNSRRRAVLRCLDPEDQGQSPPLSSSRFDTLPRSPPKSPSVLSDVSFTEDFTSSATAAPSTPEPIGTRSRRHLRVTIPPSAYLPHASNPISRQSSFSSLPSQKSPSNPSLGSTTPGLSRIRDSISNLASLRRQSSVGLFEAWAQEMERRNSSLSGVSSNNSFLTSSSHSSRHSTPVKKKNDLQRKKKMEKIGRRDKTSSSSSPLDSLSSSSSSSNVSETEKKKKREKRKNRRKKRKRKRRSLGGFGGLFSTILRKNYRRPRGSISSYVLSDVSDIAESSSSAPPSSSSMSVASSSLTEQTEEESVIQSVKNPSYCRKCCCSIPGFFLLPVLLTLLFGILTTGFIWAHTSYLSLNYTSSLSSAYVDGVKRHIVDEIMLAHGMVDWFVGWVDYGVSLKSSFHYHSEDLVEPLRSAFLWESRDAEQREKMAGLSLWIVRHGSEEEEEEEDRRDYDSHDDDDHDHGSIYVVGARVGENGSLARIEGNFTVMTMCYDPLEVEFEQCDSASRWMLSEQTSTFLETNTTGLSSARFISALDVTFYDDNDEILRTPSIGFIYPFEDNRTVAGIWIPAVSMEVDRERFAIELGPGGTMSRPTDVFSLIDSRTRSVMYQSKNKELTADELSLLWTRIEESPPGRHWSNWTSSNDSPLVISDTVRLDGFASRFQYFRVRSIDGRLDFFGTVHSDITTKLIFFGGFLGVGMISSLVVLLLALSVVYCGNRMVMSPLKRLLVDMESSMNLNFDDTELDQQERCCSLVEFVDLRKHFISLVQSLQMYFPFIPNHLKPKSATGGSSFGEMAESINSSSSPTSSTMSTSSADTFLSISSKPSHSSFRLRGASSTVTLPSFAQTLFLRTVSLVLIQVRLEHHVVFSSEFVSLHDLISSIVLDACFRWRGSLVQMMRDSFLVGFNLSTTTTTAPQGPAGVSASGFALDAVKRLRNRFDGGHYRDFITVSAGIATDVCFVGVLGCDKEKSLVVQGPARDRAECLSSVAAKLVSDGNPSCYVLTDGMTVSSLEKTSFLFEPVDIVIFPENLMVSVCYSVHNMPRPHDSEWMYVVQFREDVDEYTRFLTLWSDFEWGFDYKVVLRVLMSSWESHADSPCRLLQLALQAERVGTEEQDEKVGGGVEGDGSSGRLKLAQRRRLRCLAVMEFILKVLVENHLTLREWVGKESLFHSGGDLWRGHDCLLLLDTLLEPDDLDDDEEKA